MAIPKLSVAVNWHTFETAVHTVLQESLRRLAQFPQLPRTEEPLNLELYRLMRQTHLELVKAKTKGVLQFVIIFDSTSQPETGDEARFQRLRKRPDFNCAMMNPQAPDHQTSQVNYYVECKRLGQAEGSWVLNENYSKHGINRFAHQDWQYSKGYTSATMVGYLQNSTPTTILDEVNTGAATRGFPSLALAAKNWAAKGVTPLSQPAIARGCSPSPFTLRHLWVDLCHCNFVTSTATPPVSAAKPPPKAKSVRSPKKAESKKRPVKMQPKKKPR